MIFLALESDRPLLIRRDCPTVLHTGRTQSHSALLIITVLIMMFPASHAAELVFLRSCWLSSHDIMVMSTCVVKIDVHQLAANTVTLLAVGAVPRTLLHFSAERAHCWLVHPIHEAQHMPTGALSVYIGDKLPRLRLVEVVRQLTEAVLTDTEITEAVVIYSVLADCSTHSADITYEVEISNLLEGKGMADGASLLGTGRHSASHTVKLTTDAAVRPTKPFILTSHAVRFQHFLIRTHKKLQLMPSEALILSLHLLAVQILRRDIGTVSVVLVEGLEGVDMHVALGGVVGTEEVQLDLGQSLHQEWLAALKRTTVHFLPRIRHTLHAVDLLARSLAANGLHADLVANAALVLVADLRRFKEACGCQALLFHSSAALK